MKMNAFLAVSVLMALSLGSCDPASQRSAEIKSIDSCLALVDDLEKVLNGIEFDSLAMMVAHVEKNEETIREYYKPDTLDERFGRLVTECKGVRKTMAQSTKKKAQFTSEIVSLRKQLSDLRTDILNGLFTDEELKNNLDREMKDLSILEIALTDFDSIQKLQSRIFYTDAPEVDLIVADLIAKNDSIPD